MTEEEQIAFHLRNFDKAWARRLRKLRDPDYKEKCRALSLKRLKEGYALWGDNMFHRSYAELEYEELCEDADAPNYRLARMWNSWPT